VRGHGGFGGSVLISAVATAVLLVAITGAQRSPQSEARGAPPWPAPAALAVDVGARVAGLSLSTQAGVVTRYAVHLDVLIDGRAMAVPAGIGLDAGNHEMAPLYTADGSGIVHVASDASAPVFTLGQFFDEWQVALTASRLGGLANGRVAVYVNGITFYGDPGAVVLKPHLEIAVCYGPDWPGRGPMPTVPAVSKSYTFPGGV
jgi:hypothetical protein